MNDRERRPMTTDVPPASPETRRPDDQRRYMPPASEQRGMPAAPEQRGMSRPEESQAMESLFPHDAMDDMKRRWTDIQAGFVDEPRRAVQEADALVASTVQRLSSTFSEARAKLEGQWSRGGDVSTEDLRVALRRYR